MDKQEKYKLVKIDVQESQKKIKLRGIREFKKNEYEELDLNLHRLALIGKDDSLLINKENSRRIYVSGVNNDHIQILCTLVIKNHLLTHGTL